MRELEATKKKGFPRMQGKASEGGIREGSRM
jgi:hypothetical protein